MNYEFTVPSPLMGRLLIRRFAAACMCAPGKEKNINEVYSSNLSTARKASVGMETVPS